MSTLEIIHLRSSGEPTDRLTDRIRESMSGEDQNGPAFTIFRQDGLAADLAVHISHERDNEDVPSPLGLQLVSALEVFGMVTHSVWRERA